MQFAVKACGNGRARAGVLQIGGCPATIETPSLLLWTRKGLPSFISLDLLPSLPQPDSHLLQISPLHFFDSPSPTTISNIGGLHQMLGLPEYGFVASSRDSVTCLPEFESTNKFGASFETPSGRRLVKPVEYMELISSLKPNVWVSLADEVPAWVNEKRNKTSVDRTVRWLDECIALDPAGGQTIMGAIVGGSSLEERIRCAQEVGVRNVSGYWIGGFGLGEEMDERPALLNAITDILPEGKAPDLWVRTSRGSLTRCSHGIDLFESTDEGHVFDSQLSDIGSDGTKINLRSTLYRIHRLSSMDVAASHANITRGSYINHLLNVHEMLAQILLEIHNTFHYLGFFRAIREAIKCDEFSLFHQKFIEGRRKHLTSASPCS